MSNRSGYFRSHAAVLAIIAGLLGTAQTAIAQDTQPPEGATTEGEPIIVTGSRIRRDPLEQTAPVAFVDRDDIDRTGLSSIADVLQRLPSAAGGLNSKYNNSGNSGNPPDGGGVGAGSAEIDLRYLGSKRTLVLVDGLRWVNGASASGVPGSTDLNTIPEGMIERIEVLQDGASAIYGSDAIAGVVNIITKKRQDGFLASAQVGAFRQGDGVTQNYNLSWGHENLDSGTSIVIGATYVKQDDVSAADRKISLFPTPGATACDTGCSSATPLGRFDIFLNGDPDSTLVLTLKNAVSGVPRWDPADPTGPNSDFKDFGLADRFNFAPLNFILTPNERYGAFLNFRQELSDTINFSLKAVYNRRNSTNEAAPIPLFIGPDGGNGNFLDTISIDATNPFNPFGVTLNSGAFGGTRNYSTVRRRFVEAGPRHFEQSVDTFYFGGTLDGSFEIGGGTWYWDVNGIYSTNDAHQVFTGNVDSRKLQRALGPVADCLGASDGCVPINIFGGAGSITQEMVDYVTFIERDRSRQSFWDGSVNLTGNLFELPAGAVGLAVGYEHRDLYGSFTPDPVVAAGFGSDIPAQPTAGGFNADEVYAELRVPLLKQTPFFNLLEASLAARYSDYSTSGSETTFKAGVNWKPFEDLRLRGTWSQGFRAPSIGELFGSLSRFDATLNDPCSDLNNSGASATVRANCIAQGVPANGSYVQSSPQISVVTGGNADLKAETSESWVFGGVYSPGWAPRLSLEANYYDIQVDGAIQAVDSGFILDNCAANADPTSCAAIRRDPVTGNIAQIQGVLQNIAGISTRGLDVVLSYRTGETGAGTFGLYWANNFLFDYTISIPAVDGVDEISREGTERGSPDQAYPKYKATGTIDWASGDWHASITGRYIDGVVEFADTPDENPMSSKFYTDIQIGWSPSFWDQRFGITLGVNNLFDTQPPGCISCNLNNFDPTTYDVPGQFGYVRLTAKM